MKVVTIGRSSKNDVFIKNDDKVSRVHLQIIQDDNGNFRVIDFNSKNGTYVNGEKINGEMPLSRTDVIKIGKTVLQWQNYFSKDAKPKQPKPTLTASKSPDESSSSIKQQSYQQPVSSEPDVKSNIVYMSEEEMTELADKLEKCVKKKKKSLKAVLTLGFSVVGFFTSWELIKSAAEDHVPDHNEEYRVNGENVRVGWYDPNKDHTGIRMIWRFFYILLYIALCLIPIVVINLLRYIYFAIRVYYLKKKLLDAGIIL